MQPLPSTCWDSSRSKAQRGTDSRRWLLVTFLLILAAAFLFFGVPLEAQAQTPGQFSYSPNDGVRRVYTSASEVSAGQLLFENSSNGVVPISAGATSGVMGVATTSASGGGQQLTVGVLGSFPVSVDGPCSIGQPVTISQSVTGYGHCQTVFAAAQVIGLAEGESSGSGSVPVLVDPLVSSPAASLITGNSNSNTEFLFSNQGAIAPQSVMTYDVNFGAVPRVDFTTQSGWDSPVLFRNAQAATNSFTVFPINTDGQFEIQEYAGGVLSALLNLDTDGHVDLYGNQGGGFLTDTNGNTCLAGNIAGNSPHDCSVAAEEYNNSGKLTKYWGQSLAGNGISAIVAVVDVGKTGNYGPTTIFTTNSNPDGFASGGIYRLDVYAVAVSGVPSSTIQFQVNYTDADYGSESQNSGNSASFAYGGSVLTYSFIINASASTPITLIANTTNSPVYTLHARLQAL